MKKRRALPLEPYILPWVGGFLLIVLLFILCAGGGKKKNAPETDAGRAWIAEQASKDPAEMERVLRRRELEEMRVQAKEARDAAKTELMDSDDDTVWSKFQDAVILGDSRAVGFYYYHFLDRSRVLAGAGDTIRCIPDHLEEIKMLNPAFIYLCYGLNDTGEGLWADGEAYGKELDERITQLQAAVPGVTVVVNSILPATEDAVARNPVWRKIPDFTAAAAAVCKEKGVIYVDNAALADEMMETYWDPDGVHLRPQFYAYWAKNMLLATIDADRD